MVSTGLAIVFTLSIAALFGAMLFFPAIVAPRVFAALDPDDAGRFLRRLFPGYYAFLIATSALAALAAALIGDPALNWPFMALGLIALSTAWVRQVLTPQLNRWRDAELAGDSAAAAKFKSGHRLSVIINLVQLVVVFAILIDLAASGFRA